MSSDTRSSFRLEAFENKFDVKEFVGVISEKLINESNSKPGPFDPKPFIAGFEATVDKLISLRKDIQVKSEQMEKSVRVSEREYSKKMTELNRRFEAVGTNFNSMENKMNEVGRTSIRIGEQLESIHIERQRTQAAYDLLDFYNSFSKEDTTRIDLIKKEGKDGRRQVATLLRRLNIVAKEVDLPNADKTRESIDRYCEKFEKEMLFLFDRSYRKGDPKMMHHCAQTLLDFNGGNSCVQVYVNQHDFFINRVAQASQIDDPALWESLDNADVTPPKSEKGLSELFNEIRVTVGQEAEIVRVVFPNPPVVMQVFLQRVFAQSIQQHMEQLLNRGSGISELSFLRILQLVHEQTAALVESLKMHELPAVIPRSPQDAAEFRRSLMTPSSNHSSSTTAVSTMLESAMEELFASYTEGQRYLDRECKCLTDLYAGLLSPFAKYHARTQAGKPTVLGRMMNQLASGNPSTSGQASQAAAALMRFGGIGAAVLSNQLQSSGQAGEEPLREEDGVLSVDVAEKMLKWHAEAVGRCVEMSGPADIPKHISSLLRVLSETLGNGYVGTALESTLSRLEATDGRIETLLKALTILYAADLICHLWQQYVNVALFPLGNSSVAIRREMTVFNSQTVSRIEGAANQVIQRVIDGVITWLAAQLVKQKRTDFKPRNDDSVFTRVNTEACAACCDGLDKVREAAESNLSGKNLEVFLTEIGVSFHALLLDHMRKFPVSATGGLMLAKDVKSYQDTIGTFSIPALSERFEFLRQLGQIFLLTPEVLKSYITEDYLGRIDANLLKPYLAQRSDWGQSEKAFNDGAVVEAAPAVDPRNAGAFGSRFARLSTMMRDMEVKGFAEGVGSYVPNVKGLQNISGLTRLPMPAIPTGLPSRFSLSTNRQ